MTCAFRVIALIFLVMILLGAPRPGTAQPPAASEIPVLIIVRHADKALTPEDDPALSVEGAARARELMSILRYANVSAIITTDLRRARDTVAPLASALGLEPETVSAALPFSRHITALLDAIRRHPGGVVLVIGHSDTVPQLIATLGGPRFTAHLQRSLRQLFHFVSHQWKTEFHS